MQILILNNSIYIIIGYMYFIFFNKQDKWYSEIKKKKINIKNILFLFADSLSACFE